MMKLIVIMTMVGTMACAMDQLQTQQLKRVSSDPEAAERTRRANAIMEAGRVQNRPKAYAAVKARLVSSQGDSSSR